MKKKWSSNNHLCTVLYNELPLIGEANYMVALNSLVHIDRIAEFNVLIYLISGSMEIIEDAVSAGHKILLFSGYTSMFEIIQKELSARNIKYFKLTGSTKVSERINLVDDFNTNDI